MTPKLIYFMLVFGGIPLVLFLRKKLPNRTEIDLPQQIPLPNTQTPTGGQSLKWSKIWSDGAEKIKPWLSGNILPVVGFFLLANIFVLYWWRSWWWHNICLSWRMWLIQIVGIVSCLMLFAKEKEKGKPPILLRWTGFAILVAFIIPSLVVHFRQQGEVMDKKATFASQPISPRLPPVCKDENQDPEVATRTKELLKDQPDLLERVKQESCFRQWKKVDGKFDHSQVLRGILEDGKTEGHTYGVAQINISINGKFCADRGVGVESVLTTVDGNIACAKLLYAEKGLEPWYVDEKSPNVLRFDFPVNQNWKKLKLISDANFSFVFEKDVHGKVDGKKVEIFGPSREKSKMEAGLKVDYIGLPKTLEFQMSEETVGHFIYTNIQVGTLHARK